MAGLGDGFTTYQQQGTGSPLTSSRGRVTPYQQQGAGHPLPAAGGGSPLTSSRGRGHPLPAAGDGISLTSCNVAANILDTSYCFAFLMTSRKYTQPPSLPASGRRRDPLGREGGREGGRDPSPSFYIPPSPHYVLRHLQLTVDPQGSNTVDPGLSRVLGPWVIQGSNTVDPWLSRVLIQWTLGYPGF